MRRLALIVFVSSACGGTPPSTLEADLPPTGAVQTAEREQRAWLEEEFGQEVDLGPDPRLTSVAGPLSSDRTVLFVHGTNPLGTGVHCPNNFNALGRLLREQGFGGVFKYVGYYARDEDCDVNVLGDQGTVQTSIREIAWYFAWYVFETYTVLGEPVDVVAHSMGGLIVRYALERVAQGDSEFPAALDIAHVVTGGTPHAGSSIIAQACIWTEQCWQMRPDSRFMDDLHASGAMPRGESGTLWTALGSNADALVGADSATAVFYDDKHVYPLSEHVLHRRYFRTEAIQYETARALLKD